MTEKKLDIKFLVEQVIGCKWSISILDMMDKGVKRPGAMVREQDGLTTKVLNERLKRFVKYKIINKKEYPEVPPRVEYEYTKLGRKFLGIIVAIRELETEVNQKG
jgi:DNA-binding HxlR family transcriptional regulator